MAAVQYEGTTSWSVKNVPAWLTVSPRAGTNAVSTQVSVEPTMFLKTPRLSGTFTVQWESADGQGSTVVKVNADLSSVLARVTGQIVPPSVQGQDAETRRPTVNTTRNVEAQSVLVKYRSASGVARALSLGAASSSAGERVAVVPTNDVNGTVRRLKQDPAVEYAVPNVMLQPLGEVLPASVQPADQYAPLQWPFRLLSYGAVWRDMEDHPYPNAVTVAVLDTGVRYDHPDLEGRLYGPGDGALDLVENDDDPTDSGTPGLDEGSHGTHVSGLIAARWGKFTPPCDTCSDSGVVGAAYKAPVKVLPVRVLGSGGGSLAMVATGIRYAAGLPITLNGETRTNPHPARVVNLSLGAAVSSANAQPLCDAIADATAHGALVVAAGGNDGNTKPFYPAACPGAIAVASVTLGEILPQQASYSNAYGAITLAAPGGERAHAYNGGSLGENAFPDLVYSTSWDFTNNRPIYEAMAGTSQATPQVSALAALVISKGLAETPDTVRQRLIDSATHLGTPGRNDVYGYGLINAAKALNAESVEPSLDVRVRQDLPSEDPQFLRLDLDAVGRFSAYLPSGSFTLDARQDTNGNGLYGEEGEARLSHAFESQPATGQDDLGKLSLR